MQFQSSSLGRKIDPPKRFRRFYSSPSCFCCGFRLRSFRHMLRSVVSAPAANMVQARCAHLTGVLYGSQRQSRLPQNRNHVPAGPLCLQSSRQRVEEHSVRPCSARYQAGKLCHRSRSDGVSPQYGEPRQPSRTCVHGVVRAGLPIFLAMSICPRFIMTVAAWQSARLRLASPALVMPHDTSRSPNWLREGDKPAHALP